MGGLLWPRARARGRHRIRHLTNWYGCPDRGAPLARTHAAVILMFIRQLLTRFDSQMGLRAPVFFTRTRARARDAQKQNDIYFFFYIHSPPMYAARDEVKKVFFFFFLFNDCKTAARRLVVKWTPRTPGGKFVNGFPTRKTFYCLFTRRLSVLLVWYFQQKKRKKQFVFAASRSKFSIPCRAPNGWYNDVHESVDGTSRANTHFKFRSAPVREMNSLLTFSFKFVVLI